MKAIYDKWLPLEEVKKLFNYKTTQMASLLKNKLLVVSKVGKRKFILKQSLDDFFDHHSKPDDMR
ncbi:MAG: helix-turn-helix domain-containing protein [Ferruginibacter sp.]|nr:helix-turn-helix domain-containing protein [Ferruginibacter sp.]